MKQMKRAKQIKLGSCFYSALSTDSFVCSVVDSVVDSVVLSSVEDSSVELSVSVDFSVTVIL